jgi:hypothetical protein
MKTNDFQTEMLDTLKVCLTKMSKKLKAEFDPNDKKSLQLLQQFRSTLSVYRAWCKKPVDEMQIIVTEQPRLATFNFPGKTHKNPLGLKSKSGLLYAPPTG